MACRCLPVACRCRLTTFHPPSARLPDRSQSPCHGRPSERLGFSHDEPQPQQTPHVALHAATAAEAGIAAPPGYDGWTSRSQTRGGGFEGITAGPSAIILSEVEQIAEEVRSPLISPDLPGSPILIASDCV